MTKVGLIRCEKNETTCPLTKCFACLAEGSQGFAETGQPELVGVMTCRCPGDQTVALAKILKAKGAEVLHWATCLFARKEDGNWVNDHGFCPDIDTLLARVSQEAGIPCVKGTAHLPTGYRIERFLPAQAAKEPQD